MEENIKRGDTTVDIFGFSRGGAAALEFAHRVQEKFSEARMNLVGLFDVVSSVGFSHGNGLLRLNATDLSASVVYHAFALDETRKLFQVQDVQGATQEGFRGAHSDVGGGYMQKVLSNIALNEMISRSRSAGVPMRTISQAIARDPVGRSVLEPFVSLDQRQLPHRELFASKPLIPYEQSPRVLPRGYILHSSAFDWVRPDFVLPYREYTGLGGRQYQGRFGRQLLPLAVADPYLSDEGDVVYPLDRITSDQFRRTKTVRLISRGGYVDVEDVP